MIYTPPSAVTSGFIRYIYLPNSLHLTGYILLFGEQTRKCPTNMCFCIFWCPWVIFFFSCLCLKIVFVMRPVYSSHMALNYSSLQGTWFFLPYSISYILYIHHYFLLYYITHSFIEFIIEFFSLSCALFSVVTQPPQVQTSLLTKDSSYWINSAILSGETQNKPFPGYQWSF